MNTWSQRAFAILGRVYLTAIMLFLFLPVTLIVLFSFNRSQFFTLPLNWFTIHWFSVAYHNSEMVTALENSLKVAGLTAVISTTLSFVAALGLRRASGRTRRIVDFATPLPLLVPVMIWSVALLITIAKVNLLPSVWTIVVGHVLLTTPFVFLLIMIRIDSFRQEWAEAAESLGAGRFFVLRRVIVPHVAPAIAAGVLMAFTISFNDFIVAFFLTGQTFTTLPVYIYSYIHNLADPSIAAVSTLVFLLVLMLFGIVAALQGREVEAAGRGALGADRGGADAGAEA